MRTSLKGLYDQVDKINAKVALIKKYEASFASVHHDDEHSRVVQALSIKTTSTLVNVLSNTSKLANIMEVSFPDESNTKVPQA
jgi:hypothetical protein